MTTNQRRAPCLELRENLAVLITENKNAIDLSKFSGVSAGYAGLSSGNLTLNSQFYHHLFKRIDSIDLSHPILFPQRVPRLGFFDELKQISDGKTSLTIETIQNKLTDFIVNVATKKTQKCKSNENEHLNIIKLGLRFGVRVDNDIIGSLKDISPSLRLSLIDIVINQSISDNQDIPIHLLVDALDLCDRNHRPSLINRLIVAASRYNNPFLQENEYLFKSITEEIIQNISLMSPSTNSEKITWATILRGTPMSPHFDKKETLNYLLKAEDLIQSIEPSSILELIVKNENLYTLYLTLSKYFLNAKNDKNEFLKYQNQMIALDPFDSTSFNELGLFYLKSNHYLEAENYFKKCTDLGPPSLAMSFYFLGQSLEKQGRIIEAIKAYENSSIYDPEAVSPLLDLVRLHENTERTRAIKTANEILERDILFAQINEEEVCFLRSLVLS